MQVQSKAESEAIAKLEFAARQKLTALEQEHAQQATLIKMREEVRVGAAWCCGGGAALATGPSRFAAAGRVSTLSLRLGTRQPCVAQAQAALVEMDALQRHRVAQWQEDDQEKAVRAQVSALRRPSPPLVRLACTGPPLRVHTPRVRARRAAPGRVLLGSAWAPRRS